MANAEALQDVLAWARHQEELRLAGERSEWDQSDWIKITSCGTSCCIAGRVVLTHGWEPINSGSPEGSSWLIADEHGQFAEVDDIARELLEISRDDAWCLFLAENTLADVEEIITGLLDGTFDHGTWLPRVDRVNA